MKQPNQTFINAYLRLGDKKFEQLVRKVFTLYDQSFTILGVTRMVGKYDVVIQLKNGEKRTLTV